MNIKVIGYYEHNNLGDDQYLISFKNLLNKLRLFYNIEFIDCDKIIDKYFNDNDIIILGGGDVLNNYFIDKIIQKFNNKPNKIIAISVGIPYTDILKTKKLQIFDHIFIRTKQDIELISNYYDINSITYIPDISCNLEYKENNYFHELKEIKKHKKIVGFALSRHIYNINYKDEYKNCLLSICKFINFLINNKYHIVFIPFNTNINSNSENDILIYNDIIELLQLNYYNYQHKKIIDVVQNPVKYDITFININMNYNNIYNIFKLLDICIPMRYHACLFSIHNKVPFLPIFSTRKIRNLLLDINWLYYYELEVNNIDIPININISKLLRKFIMLSSSKLDISNFTCEYNESSKKLFKILTNKTCKIKSKKYIIDITLDNVNKYIKQNNYSDFRLITKDKIQNNIVNIVSYYLTNGNMNSVYNYGLKNKMFNKNYEYNKEWDWIIKDYKKIELENNPRGLFNLNYIDQNDYSGVHRSGWQYVFENIKQYHNNDAIILDMSIDRTFHWNAEINKILNLIPYTKPWIGFVHHTFDTTFSNYNCENLLKSNDFKQSLKCCKGIIVLSNDLKNKFIKNNIHNVYSLVHPTSIDVIKFKFKNFIKNNDKKIVYIGGWLRNTYSFYNLELPKLVKHNFFINKKYNIRKVAIKGKSMNNYYPKEDFIQELQKLLSKNNSDNIIQNCSCDENINNNWYKHFYEDMKTKLSSIEIINHLSNDEYDKLLSENIVYINLVDASAINTLIECIVRNTPIVINKIPPVIELLGDHYPLYYENNNDVFNLLSNTDNIKKAYYYIKKLPKNKFLINTFIDDLKKIISNIL